MQCGGGACFELSNLMPTARARALRRSMTLPEVLLWRVLRQRPHGFKFRRQHPLGPYVLDFYCSIALVAVEVDGMAHDLGINPQRDVARDEWLATHSIKTLRYPAPDVLDDLEAVIRSIVASCVERTQEIAPPPP